MIRMALLLNVSACVYMHVYIHTRSYIHTCHAYIHTHKMHTNIHMRSICHPSFCSVSYAGMSLCMHVSHILLNQCDYTLAFGVHVRRMRLLYMYFAMCLHVHLVSPVCICVWV